MEYLSTGDLLSYRMEDTWPPESLFLEVVAIKCPAGMHDFQQWMKIKKKTNDLSTVQFQPASDAEKDNLIKLTTLLRKDKVGHQYSPSLISDTA
jgi:hypothetical protein